MDRVRVRAAVDEVARAGCRPRSRGCTGPGDGAVVRPGREEDARRDLDLAVDRGERVLAHAARAVRAAPAAGRAGASRSCGPPTRGRAVADHRGVAHRRVLVGRGGQVRCDAWSCRPRAARSPNASLPTIGAAAIGAAAASSPRRVKRLAIANSDYSHRLNSMGKPSRLKIRRGLPQGDPPARERPTARRTSAIADAARRLAAVGHADDEEARRRRARRPRAVPRRRR